MTETKKPATDELKEVDEKDEQAVFRLSERLKGKERQLHSKIADVMVIAERIPKRGKAPQVMGGYPFVQVGDAADFIRRALGRRNVSMLPESVEKVGFTEHNTAKGGIMTTVELAGKWVLTDGDTGETATFMSYGAGADTGDKFSGKAMTSMMKSAFLHGFQLSTGEDTELSADANDRVGGALPEVVRGRGRAPAQGGRQQEVTVPQKKMIGDLLRQGGVRTIPASAEQIAALTGLKVELDEKDPGASLSAWLDKLDPQVGGKLIHDLQKWVKNGKEQPADQGVSNPSAPAGKAPGEDLEIPAEA